MIGHASLVTREAGCTSEIKTPPKLRFV